MKDWIAKGKVTRYITFRLLFVLLPRWIVYMCSAHNPLIEIRIVGETNFSAYI